MSTSIASRVGLFRLFARCSGSAATAVLLGCGGGGAAPQPAPQPAAPVQPAAAPMANAPSAAVAAAPAPARSTATKWVGGIPYDVFYDRPLEVASDQTLLATAGGAAPAATTGGAATMPAPTAPAAASGSTPPPHPAPAPTAAPSPAPSAPPAGSAVAAGGIDWARLGTAEEILGEISALRNDLAQKLGQVGTYNKELDAIGVEATTLAALAGVIERHPGEVSWKSHAKIARSLASDVNSNAGKTGRTAWEATKKPFDALADLLGGNPPGDVQADDQAPFSDYVGRDTLMRRMELTLNHLKSNVNTEARLKEDPAGVKRKMAMLATMMTVLSTEGYDGVDEAEYQGFVSGFVDAALTGRDAVDGNNLEEFTASLGKMQTICAECHTKYKFD